MTTSTQNKCICASAYEMHQDAELQQNRHALMHDVLFHKDYKCWNCSDDEHPETIQKCARCFTAYYCSRECQIADWSNHKLECSNLLDIKKNKEIKKLNDDLLEMRRSQMEAIFHVNLEGLNELELAVKTFELHLRHQYNVLDMIEHRRHRHG